MAEPLLQFPKEAGELYPLIRARLHALTDGVSHKIANLSNAAALLWMALSDINWAGFYLAEGEMLVLGPFQGKPACIEIPFGKGVCGAAAQRDQVILVPDVHRFPGHIACDSASRSEIVCPIHAKGKVTAVLDIDSPTVGRFTQADADGLTSLIPVLERIFFEG